MRDEYIPGDFWRICDVCGWKVRSSQTRKRWDNLMVCLADWEPRQDQDFVRGVADRQTVPDPRPEPTLSFVGPLRTLTTAAASAGATSLTVDSSLRMIVDDYIEVMLENGNVHRTSLSAIPDSTHLTMSSALPFSVASGALVTNLSAIAG